MNSRSNSTERSIPQSQLENAESILVTIQNLDGAATDYTLERKLICYNLNGEFISWGKISLNHRPISIDRNFWYSDGENNITHIAPHCWL